MNKLTRVKSAVISGAIALSSLAAPLSSAVSPSLSATAAGGDNYAKLLQYSLYLYDANMCGNNSDCGLSWRGNCHMNDEVVGGFHDAGDHVMFGQPQGYTASTLGWAYYEFKDAFVATGQDAHLKVITDRFAKFFRDATVLNGGTVSKVLIEKGEGGQDHNYWGAPETQGDRGRMVWTTGGAANITAEYAAALAANYINFGNDEDLTYAKALYNFSKQNTGTYSVSPFYVSGESGSADELAWAAGWLYKATKDQQYLNDLNNAPEGWWVHCWENVALGAAILKAEETGNWSAVHEIGGGNEYKFYDEWGSARHNATAQLATLVAAKYNHGDAGWAKGQMEYLTGDRAFANGKSYCLIVGFKDNASKNPHHRASSPDVGAEETNDGIQNKNLLVGALCGGPTSANGDGYRDVRSDYKANEVACDYNAGLVGAAAGLYHFYKSGSIDSTITGVTKIYNGGSTTPTPGTTTTTTAPPYNVTTTTTTPTPGPSTGGKTLLPADMKVGVEDGTDGPISFAEFSPQGAKKATLYFKINTSDTQASGGFGTWTGKWEQVEFENVKADSNKEVVVDYDIPSNVGSTVKAMIWWPQGEGVTIEKIVLDGGGSSTPSVTTTTTRYNPPATTTTTTSPTPGPSTGGNGVYKVEFNKSLKFDDAADDKMIGFDWSDFDIPSGEYATKVEFNISASSNIDKWVGNFGSSTSVAPDYWYMDDDAQQDVTINSTKGTITWKIPESAAKTFSYGSGELKFGTWWTNVSSYNMDSIVVYTAKGAAATTTTTAKPVITTTTTTTTAPPYNPPATTTTTTTPPKAVKYGDTNCDGQIELADAILIMQALANPNKYGLYGSDPKHLTEQGKLNGDVDRRTTGLTSNDALTIQEYLLHSIYTLPIV
ncbi:glycoside hydrolase family 9 protein [uncultured Ruminococcus sp.]|uniref:glycoside hydrolase family 9 protein n=1 Tax=uncultured Ruminococcus sp. TaxID=165186 RepID=UPI0026085B86|nr:glycoside hydrolase family 9 protein [uncultured Ruminococcus sp.]